MTNTIEHIQELIEEFIEDREDNDKAAHSIHMEMPYIGGENIIVTTADASFGRLSLSDDNNIYMGDAIVVVRVCDGETYECDGETWEPFSEYHINWNKNMYEDDIDVFIANNEPTTQGKYCVS